jgi:hypothetical protein
MIVWKCSGGKASLNGHSHTSECEQRNADRMCVGALFVCVQVRSLTLSPGAGLREGLHAAGTWQGPYN